MKRIYALVAILAVMVAVVGCEKPADTTTTGTELTNAVSNTATNL